MTLYEQQLHQRRPGYYVPAVRRSVDHREPQPQGRPRPTSGGGSSGSTSASPSTSSESTSSISNTSAPPTTTNPSSSAKSSLTSGSSSSSSRTTSSSSSSRPTSSQSSSSSSSLSSRTSSQSSATSQTPTTSPTTTTTPPTTTTQPTTTATTTTTPTTAPTPTTTPTPTQNAPTTITTTTGTNIPSTSSPDPSSAQSTSTMSLTTVMTLTPGHSSSGASPVPTKLQSNTTPITSVQRRAIIAGSASGFVLLLLALLGGIFYYRRRKNKKFEFLDALAAPTQKEHSRAMLLAGEDMDDFASRADRDPSSFGLGHVRGDSAGGSGSYRDLAYPSPSTPWDSGSGDPRSSIEALHHPSRAPPTEATQYMSQYLMRARGSETGSVFHEGVWPPPGEGAVLVDPILRSSSQVDLGGIVESIMGPEEEGGPAAEGGRTGDGGHRRNGSGNSHAPLLPPVATAGLPPSPPLGPTHTAAPARSSPLKDAVVGRGDGSQESGGTQDDKLARTRNWIERSLAR